ncbi:MAG: histidine kinase dimerization/phospho-acceptor domain-containing protein, partial [Nitrospirota bacterium]
MGHATSLPIIAERILSGFSEASRHSQGLLYLLDRERECFRLVSVPTPTPSIAAPPIVPLNHPLVQQLADRQDILDSSVLADSLCTTSRDNTTEAQFATLPINLAIPLLNRGRLIAFVVLQSQRESTIIPSYTLELLTAMAQSAANAIDSLLLYEDLRQSQVLMRRTDRLRSLETIAGGFAHEIRNPLTSIKTFIQLAPERKDDSQFIGEFSRIVLDDVNRIERLIQEILDYARYMEPQLTDEDLNEIVSSCLYFIQVKAD